MIRLRCPRRAAADRRHERSPPHARRRRREAGARPAGADSSRGARRRRGDRRGGERRRGRRAASRSAARTWCSSTSRCPAWTASRCCGRCDRRRPHVVFATAYDEYAIRAFEVQAVDYLLKPFARARVDEAVRARPLAAGPGPRRRLDVEAVLRRLEERREAYIAQVPGPQRPPHPAAARRGHPLVRGRAPAGVRPHAASAPT